MRRLIAPAAVLVVLALTGCSGPGGAGTSAQERTSKSACAEITGSWDEFGSLAESPAHDQSELVSKRSAMLQQWAKVTEKAPDWTVGAITPAIETMRGFGDGSHTDDESSKLYDDTKQQIEMIRQQCTTDGNL